MPPSLNHPGQEHEKDTIRFRACRPFHLTLEDDELLSQKRVFRHQLGFTSAKISQCSKRQGGSEWSGPLKKASTETLHRRNHEPLEMRKNHYELLLEEVASISSRPYKHLSTFSNCTLVAPRSATIDETLFRSYESFFRTDVPSSQYSSRRFFGMRCRSAEVDRIALSQDERVLTVRRLPRL